MSLHESAKSGSRIKALEDLRDLLAEHIENCDSLRDLASLSGRFQATLAEIAELSPPAREGDVVDEIAQRRSSRRSGSGKGAARAKGTG